ncbi:MAG: DegV family protein [Defluviitaleaceae bacterium]|nr:DegV family protein [Defluviitaleaceae bacterium]
MFQIVSDGGSDFTQEEVKKYGVEVVPFYVNFDDEFLKVGVDISTEAFFNRLSSEKGVFPKTSQPNPHDYVEVCETYLKEGKDIVLLTISSKLSGSHNSALVAADILKEDYPDRKITVIDSLNGSVAQGLILREMIKMRDAGYSLERTEALTKEVMKTTRIYFTLDTLEYLKRGGRVGPTTAFVGGILGLRPILQLEDGEVSQLDNVRGKKNVLRLIKEAMVGALEDEKEKVSISVGHILSEKEALSFKTSLEEALGIQIDNPITAVGATIGAHAGPGALAFAYCKKYETLEGEI